MFRFDNCDGNWSFISPDKIRSDTAVRMITLILKSGEPKLTGISYLWDQNPVKGYLNAPIYSSDKYR